MVKHLNSFLNGKNHITDHKGIIFELVGPPGSGKTTLTKTLSHYPQIQHVPFPYYRNIKYFPFFTRNTIAMLPTFACLYRNSNGGGFTREEVAWLVILQGWHRLLRRKAAQDKIILLDQGPIFFLYWLYGFGSAIVRNPCLRPWWEEMIKLWSETLDLVIWLDAPDDILVERIHSREIEHLIKGKPIQTIQGFLSNTRAALNYVISALTADAGDLKVLHIDTAQIPPRELAQDLFVRLTEESKPLFQAK